MWDKEDNLPMNKSLQKTQIGRCGELLVQQRLLRLGIESAALTTDTGIDLVAYAPGQAAPVTIQVKTKLVPVSAGGRGHSALDWWVPEHCPAELVALVDLSEDRVWLLRMGEVAVSTCACTAARDRTSAAGARPLRTTSTGSFFLAERRSCSPRRRSPHRTSSDRG
jgi:hypothetical protein